MGGTEAAALAPAAGSSSAGGLPRVPSPAGHTQQTVRGQRVSQGADPTLMPLNGGSRGGDSSLQPRQWSTGYPEQGVQQTPAS